MNYLKRAETILFQISEMHSDETFVTEGHRYFEDCAKRMAEEMAKIEQETLQSALDRVFFTRCSLVLKNNQYTQGFIDACKKISNEIIQLEGMDPWGISCHPKKVK